MKNALSVMALGAGAAATAMGLVLAGYYLALDTAAQPDSPVSVSIIYDASGEPVDVDVTDARGNWVPTSTITEQHPHDEEN